ncbi:MAG: hypothetical protein L7F78_21175, partial [Syntrophales bacterium LBB04]|nr:hypothetical protein [Syntrophales bacterium LBB04]
DGYVREQSCGKTWVDADFRGWVNLPNPISAYKLSPHNFDVDKTKIRKLIEDTMTALEDKVDFSQYQHILVIPGAQTSPGKGYGMLCYCANPGMLTGVMKEKVAYATLKSKRGKEFKGGVFVSAENAHLGMFAHDFFHALGGIHEAKRLVPCLYDYERQSDTSQLPSFENHAIYMGAWDIMSQHFVKNDEPPPGISSFTKIRLGWISPEQVRLVKPGETAMVFLSPLEREGDTLVLKIPLEKGRYYLVENRQPVGFDHVLPDSGILILAVSPDAEEGYGTVKVMDANQRSPHFPKATFRLDQTGRDIYVDKKANTAIIPLWQAGEKTGVLVTTTEKGEEALNGARLIQRLLARYPKPREKDREELIQKCVSAFKNADFKGSASMAQDMLK